MSTEMSQRQLQGMLASETDEIYLPCLTISHPSFAAPYRLVCDTRTMQRAAGEFEPFAFDIKLPVQGGDSPPQVQMSIDNVDNKILVSIRNLPAGVRPDVLLEVVTAAEPDTAVIAPCEFQILSIDYDEGTVNATIGFEDDILNTVYPARTYTPTNSPGLFL